jgi:putative GTP pyrophosphokinase
MIRKGYKFDSETALKKLNDISGVRVICSYIDDIYIISNMLTSQDDIELICTKDYIKNPKSNGYRSLHLIVTVPVFLSKLTEYVKVEIQIRTMAMDFWASLEHEITYKLNDRKNDKIIKELKDCADVIANTDKRMQNLYNTIIPNK